MENQRRVNLRAEADGADRRYLDAHVSETGDLVIEGQDLGPATALISPDGEYEWIRTVRRTDLPALVLALGGQPGDDILDLLDARFTGQRSYDLERLLRDGAAPSELHVI